MLCMTMMRQESWFTGNSQGSTQTNTMYNIYRFEKLH